MLPFLFGLAALTGVMLLNVVSRKVSQLLGKGLAPAVIGEFFVLSLPFILAMSLPLAVLTAALYAFSHLASDSEVTAMRASGVSVWEMLRPVAAWAVLMGVVTFGFVDQVLPRANARLRNLQFDIARKKPTVQLAEQVVNPVPPSPYFLRASRIDPATGRMRSVSIYDVGQAERRRIIYADSGEMAMSANGRDLSLRLHDGTVVQLSAVERGRLQHTRFRQQQIVIRDVFDSLQRSADQLDRGDREMSTCELMGVVDSARHERRAARGDRARWARNDLAHLLGLPGEAPLAPPPPSGSAAYRGAYCGAFRALATRLGGEDSSETPAAAAGAQPVPGPGGPAGALPAAPSAPSQGAGDGTGVPSAGLALAQEAAPAPLPAARPVPPALTGWGDISSAFERERIARKRADRYAVEVHKKWALSVGPLPFVLLAVALALRFPRGGMGLVLGGGMFVYAVFYVGLTAGESLADRGHVRPALAMWAPNAILAALALLGLWRVNRESGSTRGGDLGEVLDLLRNLLPRRRRRAAAA